MKGFKAFLLRGNVVDLAIAVVIGVAFGVVITAFVKDLITPLIAALGGQPDFASQLALPKIMSRLSAVHAKPHPYWEPEMRRRSSPPPTGSV